MKKKTIIIISVLLISAVVLLVVKNVDYLVNKYEWHRSDIKAETSYDESIKKFKAGQKLTTSEISQLIAYFNLSSKEDEGINFLKEILQRQDSYIAYFGLSQLYAAKARMKSTPEAHLDSISNSSNYLSEGFKKVPDKALAYYTRGFAYAFLGCSDLYMTDLKKAIEESINTKTVMIDDGIYVDQAKFAESVQKRMNQKRNYGPCLLDEMQKK
jgi:hypothetical protein